MFVTEIVFQFQIFLLNTLASSNILFMLVTLFVSQPHISQSKAKAHLNISFILVTFFVSQFKLLLNTLAS